MLIQLFGYFFRQSCLIVFLFGGIIDAVTADVNVYFLPDDGRCLSNILRNLRAAQQQVTIASYFITNEHIITQLIELKESKVDIQIIYDSSTAGNEGLTDRLLKAGIIPIVSDFIDEGKTHNKFIVIDDEDVWTGSANLTATAFAQAARAANYENMLKIKSRDIATQYKQNFESIQDDIFKIYVDEFATHPRDQVVAWKRNLIERLSEKNNVFRTRLVNTIGAYSRSNIPAKNMLMHNFPILSSMMQPQPQPLPSQSNQSVEPSAHTQLSRAVQASSSQAPAFPSLSFSSSAVQPFQQVIPARPPSAAQASSPVSRAIQEQILTALGRNPNQFGSYEEAEAEIEKNLKELFD